MTEESMRKGKPLDSVSRLQNQCGHSETRKVCCGQIIGDLTNNGMEFKQYSMCLFLLLIMTEKK